MVDEIIKRILDLLTGFDFYVAIAAVLICTIGWFWIGADKDGKKKLKRQFRLVAKVLIVVGLLIGIHHLIPQKQFPSDVAGILVLRIAGDDSSNSLQNELVSSLNAELAKQATGQSLEVWADDNSVNEKKGLLLAHKKAREVGEKRKALLVIWGNTSDKIRFFPRITIVSIAGPVGDGTLSAQDIHEVNLPEETVQKPIFIANFIAGFSFYDKGFYSKASDFFEAALNSGHAAMPAAVDLLFMDGISHWHLAYGQANMANHLEKAINYLSAASNFYQAVGNTQNLAKALTALGAAYDELKVGNLADNLNKAIGVYQAALNIVSEKDDPTAWAVLQNNLGNAWRDLPSGSKTENINRAIEAFKAALRVRTEKDFPYQWAMTQNNLGIAYRTLESGNRIENLQNAIIAFQAALRVLNEKNYPIDWGLAQNGLGNIYAELPDGDHDENIRKAIGYYQAALHTLTQTNAPFDWAMIQKNLGGVYAALPAGDNGQNSKLALVALEAALSVYDKNKFPYDWAETEINMGTVYMDLPSGNKVENLKHAVSIYHSALNVLTETNFPNVWATAQFKLGCVSGAIGQFEDPVEHAKEAREHFLNALKIWTPDDFPEDNALANKLLNELNAWLKQIGAN